MRNQLNVYPYLPVDNSCFICDQSSLKKTHLADVNLLILNILHFTTFRMINLRVKKLLFSSISEVLEGSNVFRKGFVDFSGSDFKVKKGTA